MRPGVHGPLTRPVLIPTSGPAPRAGNAKSLRDRSWVCEGPVPCGSPQDRELAAAGIAFCPRRVRAAAGPGPVQAQVKGETPDGPPGPSYRALTMPCSPTARTECPARS